MDSNTLAEVMGRVPGVTLEVRTWTADWRKWQGGTDHSFLGAFRLSEDPGNPGQGTVRDETRGEAEADR